MSAIIYFIIILSCMIPLVTGIMQSTDQPRVSKEMITWIEKSIKLPNGIKLEYIEQGSSSGTPVILLHGWTDSWNSFERVLPLLPESYHVFAPSMRGHGDSDKPSEGYHPNHFATDLAAFMDALKLDSAILVGFSMGGVISNRFVLDYPGRVDGLVLIGTPVNLDGKPQIDELWQLLLTLEDPIAPEFVRAFNADVPVKPVPAEFMEHINQANMKVPAHVWRDAFKGVWEADMLEDLDEILAPTLVLWGDHDSFTTVNDQKELSLAFPNSHFKVYSGNGHAIHWEEPEKFSKDLIEFIEKNVQ